MPSTSTLVDSIYTRRVSAGECYPPDLVKSHQLNTQGIFFVTRLRKNARYRVTERRSVRKSKGLTSDQTIELAGAKAANCPVALRRIGFKDTETGIQYYFLTNNFKLAASTIAEIYKARLADRTVLQVDQAEPEDQELPGHLPQCRHAPDLDRHLRLSVAGLPQVRQPNKPEHAADPETTSAESF